MNATLDQDLQQQLNDEIANFVMPRPKVGQCVQWFPHGSAADRPEIVFVVTVNARGLMVRTATGLAKESVRHVNDPRLRQNEFQRANGAWDFTEYDKDVAEHKDRLASLEQRLARLEKDLAKDAKKNASS